MKNKTNKLFIALAGAAFFALIFSCASGAADNSEKKWPVVFQGDLSFDPGVNYVHITEDAKTVLKELGVKDGEDYRITLIRDANRVLIGAADKKTKDTVWKTIKDIENNYNNVVRSEVIPLQYASAAEVAEMLTNIYSKKIYIMKDDDKITVKKDDNNIDISKDTRTNSIIVTAPQNIIGVIFETVRKLDCKTDQIHIKVLIAEVSLDDTMQYGVEWKYSDTSLLGDASAKPNALVDYGYQKADKQDGLMGFKYSVLAGDKLNMFIQMLRTESHIDVMASPELLTSNNMKAQFQETVKVPVLKTTMTSNGVITTSTEYQNVGIDLLVLPQVNIDGYINLEIAQTIQNIIDTLKNKQNAPTYSNRVINTNVLVKNGSTVVIGGLFKNNEGAVSAKIPGTQGVPLLRKLFGRSLKNNVKTELMVFLTPEIVKTDDDFDKTVEGLKAPAIKERLKDERAEKMAGMTRKDKPRIKVLSVAENRVVISAGAADDIKKGEEFKIVRPEKEYYHPETHQLVSVEEKEIARIKVEAPKDKSAIASVINAESNETILAGDLVVKEESQVLFENFKIAKMKVELNPADNYRKTAVKSDVRIKNTTKNPIIKTKMLEKLIDRTTPGIARKVVTLNHEKYRVSIVEDGRARPLKLTEKLSGDALEISILFDRIIGPEEEVDLRIETVYNISLLGGAREIEKQTVSAESFVKLNTTNGPKDPDTSIGLSINFPDKIIIKDFNYVPAVLDNAMDGTTLVWTQEGSPINVKGRWRFEDPVKVSARGVKSEAK
jgi:Flp pilus assembly secretin CpaC